MNYDLSGLKNGSGARYLLAVAIIVTVVVRVWYAVELSNLRIFDELIIDSKLYDEWAISIAKGDWMGGSRPFYMDPLYSYFLAIQYKILGHNLLAVRLVQAFLGIATAVLVAIIGTRLGGMRVGGIAALLVAVYQPLVFEGGEVEKTALGVFLATAFLACAMCRSTATRFLAGACLALAVLCRGNLLLIGPLAALYFLLNPNIETTPTTRVTVRINWQTAKSATAFALGFILLLSPVLLRNHHVSGEWVLTTSQLGANFYTGNNPSNWSGAYDAVPFVRPLPTFEEYDFKAKAEEISGRKLSSKQVSSFWLKEGLKHIANQPAFASMVFLRKFILFWSDLEIPDGWSVYFVKRYSTVLGALPLTFGCLLPFALLGAAASFRQSRESRFLVGFVLVYSLSVLLFFVFSRYRIYIVPALCVFAAFGIVWLWERFRAHNWRHVAFGGAAVLVAAVFSFYGSKTFGYSHEIFMNNYAQLAELYESKGDYESAETLLQESLRLRPQVAATLCALGSLRIKSGDLTNAIDYLHQCIDVDPEFPNAWNILGAAYDRAGKYPEARKCFEMQLKIIPGHQQATRNLELLQKRHF